MGQRPIIGETYQPNAGETRRFQRVADEFDKQLLSVGGKDKRENLGPGVCNIKNGTGSPIAQFGILGIDDVWVEPTDSESRFCSYLPLTGAVPTTADHDGKFAVLMDPAAANQVVRAVVAGVVPVKVSVTNGAEWYDHADVAQGNTAALTLLPAGAAQVLWKEDGDGEKWAIVRLGNPTGDVTLMGKTDEAINTGNTGNCSVYLTWGSDGGEVVTATNPESLSSDLNTNTSVSLTWLSRYRKWICTGCSNTA